MILDGCCVVGVGPERQTGATTPTEAVIGTVASSVGSEP